MKNFLSLLFLFFFFAYASATAQPVIEAEPFDCGENEESSSTEFIPNVCNAIKSFSYDDEEISTLYAVEHNASLVRHGNQSLIVLKTGQNWYLTAGTVKKDGEAEVIRLYQSGIDEDIGRNVNKIFSEESRQTLQKYDDTFDYYGNKRKVVEGEDHVICSDGGSLTLSILAKGEEVRYSRHSCAGNTPIDELVKKFAKSIAEVDRKTAKNISRLTQ